MFITIILVSSGHGNRRSVFSIYKFDIQWNLKETINRDLLYLYLNENLSIMTCDPYSRPHIEGWSLDNDDAQWNLTC